MATKKARIDLKTKYEIIKLVKSGMKKEEIRKKFNLKNRSNINIIMNNEEKIMKSIESMNKKKSAIVCRIKASTYPDVEEALILWMKNVRANEIPLSGETIKAKASEFAKQLNHNDFKATDGYLRGLKRRNNLAFIKERRIRFGDK